MFNMQHICRAIGDILIGYQSMDDITTINNFKDILKYMECLVYSFKNLDDESFLNTLKTFQGASLIYNQIYEIIQTYEV